MLRLDHPPHRPLDLRRPIHREIQHPPARHDRHVEQRLEAWHCRDAEHDLHGERCLAEPLRATHEQRLTAHPDRRVSPAPQLSRLVCAVEDETAARQQQRRVRVAVVDLTLFSVDAPLSFPLDAKLASAQLTARS